MIIESMGSQGPGGNALLLAKLSYPLGATIFTSNFTLGDSSLDALELLNAQYQESVGLLVDEDNKDRLNAICRREKCPADYVGVVSGNGHLTVFDDDNQPLVNLPVEALDVSRPTFPSHPAGNFFRSGSTSTNNESAKENR